PEYLDSLGWVYFQKGAYELARAYLERAARRDTNEPVILEHLGDAYERLGRLKEARVFYEKALAAAKKMPPRPDIDIPRLKRKLLKLASENGVVAAERP
ncbi:MAG: tetratricopeptide repeat protein, partial [Candidatus Hydrogenedentota bacterium]